MGGWQGMVLTNPAMKAALGIPSTPKTDKLNKLENLKSSWLNPNRHDSQACLLYV